MSNGSSSVSVSGNIDLEIGTRSPKPEPPPPPPPQFFVYGLGLFGLVMGVIAVITCVRIITGAIDREELTEHVLLAAVTGVLTVVAMSIGTRTPKDRFPPPPAPE